MHLAKVKLEAEERAHLYRMQIKKLEQEKLEQQQVLREAFDRVSALETQVKTLEVQNTRKWQIESRDHWIAQVETLKQERNRLRMENENMAGSLKKLQGTADDESIRKDFTVALTDLTSERNARDGLKKQLELANERAEKAEAQARAFKKKLDFELELKWERSRQTAIDDEGGNASILDVITEVVAPRLS
jgi:predicted transposase YbfD/YdcC